MTSILASEASAALEAMATELERSDRSELLRRCANVVRQAFRDNFTSSASPDNENWRPRKKEGDGHPLLIDRGDLLQAATGGGAGHISRVEGDEIAIGVNLDVIPYARAHNYGRPEINLPQREWLGVQPERTGEIEDLVAEWIEQNI